MAKLIFHPELIPDKAAFAALCPFGAIEVHGDAIEPTAGCKMCGLCVKKGPAGAAEMVQDAPAPQVDKSAWRGILVYADHVEGALHPVTFELLGKARELAAEIGHPVYALLLGDGVKAAAEELTHWGADRVLVYDQPALRDFRLDAYTAAFADAVAHLRPTAILVGATTVGRQLAPRVAARLHTGLTADCTVLKMEKNTDLVQIRPAFGGNIMAQIITPNHRPQMATVRYKVMDAPARQAQGSGAIESRALPPEKLQSGVTVLSVTPKPAEAGIEHADVLVVAGRGLRKESDLQLLKDLAEELGGQLACTRPLVECGWVEARRQVGLSGRTVRPRLLITCGVSGAIQFVAGMNHAGTIIAINKDENAPIFKTAHVGLVGDLYEIVPALTQAIRADKEARP